MLARYTVRRIDILFCGLFVVMGLIGMNEGYKLGPGWGETGPQAGFFPFALAVLMVLGAAASLIQAWVRHDDTPYFEHPQEIVDLLKVGIPLAIAIATIPFLGLYLMSAAYLLFFSRWYGRHSWLLCIVMAVAVPTAMYLALQVGFGISMPRSMWYGPGFLV